MIASLLLCAAALAPGASYRARYPLPDLTVPNGWGVNIHFNVPQPGEMEKLAGAGFRWIRQDLSWNAVERGTDPKYDFSGLEALFAACDKHGVRPLIILDYGNDLYQPGSPRTPASRKAFCDMVAALMARFRGRGAVWEMWNEPNIFFWQPRPNVEEYIALATEVGKTIRRVAPNEWYVGPATSGLDWAFLERCFQAGLLRYWDAVTVHPYRNQEPETAMPDWARLRALIDRYQPAGQSRPMMSGEWGYSELYSGLNLELQTKYVVRQYLTNLASGVPLSIWYDWKDDGLDPKEIEHHFGTVYSDLKDKPTIVAKAAAARALDGYRFHLRLDAGPGRHRLLFRRGEAMKLADWGTRASDPLPAYSVPKQSPELALAMACRPFPASVAIGGPDDARRFLVQVRQALPKGATVAVEGELDRVAEVDPFEAKLKVARGPVRLSVPVWVVPRRPLPTTIRMNGGRLELVVANPGGRSGDLTVAYQGRVRRSKLTAKDAERVIALGDPAPGPVRASLDGRRIFDLPSVAWHPLPALTSDAYRIVDDGDPKLKGEYATRAADGFEVAYTFPVGWKFFQVAPLGKAAEPIPGKPHSLGLWVRADGSGDLLRMRYTDATGQTFQPEFGALTWKGWRHVSVRLDGSGGRWGGANDGVVHHPVRIEAVALVDSPGGRGGKGTVAFREPTLLMAQPGKPDGGTSR